MVHDRKCAYANDDLSKDPRSKNGKFEGLMARILTRCQMQYLAGSVQSYSPDERKHEYPSRASRELMPWMIVSKEGLLLSLFSPLDRKFQFSLLSRRFYLDISIPLASKWKRTIDLFGQIEISVPFQVRRILSSIRYGIIVRKRSSFLLRKFGYNCMVLRVIN